LPHIWGRSTPKFYSSLLASFTLYHLAQFGSLAFGDLVCVGWQQSGMQHLLRVGKTEDAMDPRL